MNHKESVALKDHIPNYIAGEISIGKLVELIPNKYDLVGAFAQYIDELRHRDNNKPLKWEDLKVNHDGWVNRKSEKRVHVSVKGAGFMMHTFWLKDWPSDRPETKAAILLVMNREISKKVECIRRFFNTPNIS